MSGNVKNELNVKTQLHRTCSYVINACTVLWEPTTLIAVYIFFSVGVLNKGRLIRIENNYAVWLGFHSPPQQSDHSALQLDQWHHVQAVLATTTLTDPGEFRFDLEQVVFTIWPNDSGIAIHQLYWP